MTLAPIALFTYQRPDHTRRTVEALAANELASQSDLYIFCDGPKSSADSERVEAVRKYVSTISGFKSISTRKSELNLGLAESIIRGVTEICESQGRVIVLEDDLVTAPWFLRYMNDGLATYETSAEVASIHGYVYPVRHPLPETFFIKGADCWGWATWARGWNLFNRDGASLLAELEARGLASAFDFEDSFSYTAMLKDQIAGRNHSWAIRWYASAFLQGRLTLYPGRSLVQNIGFDDTGVHGQRTAAFDACLSSGPIEVRKLPLRENETARAAFRAYFLGGRLRSWRRLLKQAFRSKSACT